MGSPVGITSADRGQVLCTKTIFPHPPSNGCFPEMGASAAKAFMELLDQAMMEGAAKWKREKRRQRWEGSLMVVVVVVVVALET